MAAKPWIIHTVFTDTIVTISPIDEILNPILLGLNRNEKQLNLK